MDCIAVVKAEHYIGGRELMARDFMYIGWSENGTK